MTLTWATRSLPPFPLDDRVERLEQTSELLDLGVRILLHQALAETLLEDRVEFLKIFEQRQLTVLADEHREESVPERVAERRERRLLFLGPGVDYRFEVQEIASSGAIVTASSA